MKETNKETGAICGGIIKKSELEKHLKENTVEEVMMAMVLPDKIYDKYYKLKDNGKDKEATKLFEKHAWSLI